MCNRSNTAILTVVAFFMLVACFASLSFADNRDVTITKVGNDLVFNPNPFGKCDAGQTVTFHNQSGITIQMRAPGGVWRTAFAGDTLQFPCTNDPQDCYEYSVPNKDGVWEVRYVCAGDYVGELVPTLSEWGLIIFSLLILTLITVVVARRRTATSAAGGGADVTLNGPLFVPRLFLKTLTATLGLAAVILVGATLLSTGVPLRDIAGTILSAGIVAYMAHLWLMGGKS
jgi:hypothetical protein